MLFKSFLSLWSTHILKTWVLGTPKIIPTWNNLSLSMWVVDPYVAVRDFRGSMYVLVCNIQEERVVLCLFVWVVLNYFSGFFSEQCLYNYCSVCFLKHLNETCRYTYCRVGSAGTKVQLVIVKEVIQHVLLICVPKIILAMAHVAVEGIKPRTGWEVAFITESKVPPFSKKGKW